MPWKGATVEDMRYQFILSVERDQDSISKICDAFGISRKTGHKWLKRYQEGGKTQLLDRSRRPLARPGDTSPELEAMIIQVRLRHPFWGAKKIRKVLMNEHPSILWPSPTTVWKILNRNGYTNKRRKRSRLAQTSPIEDCNFPNDVWSSDFKGWWLTKDGKTCEPLTIFDGYSRFLFCCKHVRRKNYDYVWNLLQEVFQEYGMPKRFRTDNGSPFATTSLGRLSRLAVKLIRLGVVPEWIAPGKPQENGRHERMHRSLKLEAGTPPKETLAIQESRLDRFKYEYNEIRPHEALEMLTPREVYTPSLIKWTGEEDDPQYSEEYEVRCVDKKGFVHWRGMRFFSSEVLKRETIGIKQSKGDLFEVRYGSILLGYIDPIRGFSRV
jgi:putative transposase